MKKGKFKKFFGNKCIRSLEVALGIGFVSVTVSTIITTMVKGKNDTDITDDLPQKVIENLRQIHQKIDEIDTIRNTCENVTNNIYSHMNFLENADVKDDNPLTFVIINGNLHAIRQEL